MIFISKVIPPQKQVHFQLEPRPLTTNLHLPRRTTFPSREESEPLLKKSICIYWGTLRTTCCNLRTFNNQRNTIAGGRAWLIHPMKNNNYFWKRRPPCFYPDSSATYASYSLLLRETAMILLMDPSAQTKSSPPSLQPFFLTPTLPTRLLLLLFPPRRPCYHKRSRKEGKMNSTNRHCSKDLLILCQPIKKLFLEI